MTTIDETDTARSYPKFGADVMRRNVRVVDLTREIFEGMPMWFGHQKTFINTNQTHEQFKTTYNTHLGFEAHNLLISEHAGTHTDAVFEYDPNGPTIDKSPLEYYYGDAICLDLRSVNYPDYITPADLEAALAASGQEIRKGDTVILYTGYGDATYPDLAYTEKHTGLNRDAALWLAERGVVNIAVDNVAIDHADDTEFSGHNVCGEYGIVNTEGLANLDQVVNQRFLYFGLPLFIRNGTGSPIRAVAVFQD
ncbi:MAG: cyclase family protein [Mycobacterium sp.]